MNTPQKKGKVTNKNLETSSQKKEKETRLHPAKNTNEKPSSWDIRNLPYSKEGIGEQFIFANTAWADTLRKKNSLESAEHSSKARSSDNTEQNETLLEKPNSFNYKEIFGRMRNYKQHAPNHVLLADERELLGQLLVKALAPPAEIVFDDNGDIDFYEAKDMFENLTDNEEQAHMDKIYRIAASVSVTIGHELGYYLYNNELRHINPEVVTDFCIANNLPSDLFTKNAVFAHMYMIELLHQGIDPIALLLNVDSILQIPKASINSILKSAYNTLAKLTKNDA
jgi:hypothetical protein